MNDKYPSLFLFCGNIWMLAGILLRLFPVHHFRWRHYRWYNFWWRHFRWCNFRWRHCSTNANWMVHIKKDTSDWFLGLFVRFFFHEKRPHWSIWIVALNSIFFLAGKFEFWREIWILVGISLRLFPVHHFRWRHFRWYNFRWCYFRWRHFRWCSFRWCHCSSPAPPQLRPGWCIYTTGGA